MEGYGGPAQPSPTIAQCLNGEYEWLDVERNRCMTRATMALKAIRRVRDKPPVRMSPKNLLSRLARNPVYSKIVDPIAEPQLRV